jgi:hypothetical protein
MPLMIDKRAKVGGVLIACALAVTACSSEDGGGITVEKAREAAVGAGSSPTSCPIPFDVSAALPGSPKVRPGEVEVQTSKTTTPAADPLAAQRDEGMSPLDTIAGVSIDCRYDVDGRTVDAWLIATPGSGSINLFAPTIASAGGLDNAQLRDFLDDPPEPGEVKLTPGGEAALARVRIEGDGDASLLVDPDGVVTGDALSKAAKTLLDQIRL